MITGERLVRDVLRDVLLVCQHHTLGSRQFPTKTSISNRKALKVIFSLRVQQNSASASRPGAGRRAPGARLVEARERGRNQGTTRWRSPT